jgi:hypothetical protein
VRLKPQAIAGNRPHLFAHAKNQDIGVVAAPLKRAFMLAQLYTNVHFEQCGQNHRVLDTEIEPA